MKAVNFVIVLLVLAAAGVGNAWADRGHPNVGAVIGPYWGPKYNPPYYPPVDLLGPASPVYVERQPVRTATPAAPTAGTPANYWYYCAVSSKYYPTVMKCPGGWTKVLAQPAGREPTR